MKIFVMLSFILVTGNAIAQGEIRNFSLPDVAGDTVALTNYPSIPAIAVIFTSNECAYDNYYTARIRSLIELYSGKVQFILINSSPDVGETMTKMKVKYAAWGLHVPYLADKEQKAMNIFEAKKSPETFLLRTVNGKFVVAYRGALDDNPQVAVDVKNSYLKTSIDKLLESQQIAVPTTRAVGCSIRKK